MRVIRMSELAAAPWKNGGGVTREIAAARNGDSLIWRLSMADVTSDGPFSRFEGLTRILTVVTGNGMELIGPTGTQLAEFGVPVRFDGATPVLARLKDGSLRDLNLMFDPSRLSAEVVPIIGPQRKTLSASASLTIGIFALKGTAKVGTSLELHEGDTALCEAGEVSLQLAGDAVALIITLAKQVHVDASNDATAVR
jgi:uncharacterized protein